MDAISYHERGRVGMRLSFEERSILITGATRGIGKQIADDLEALGATLLLTGTQKEEVDLLNSTNAQAGKRRYYYAVDFLDVNSVESFLEDLQDQPVIDGLVNNAGINRLNYIFDAVDKDWDDMLAVNLTAPFKLVRAVSKKMISRKYGRIVNIASIFSKISKEKRSVYSATKFGVHGFTVGISNDLSRHNILVNTVSPGFVLTDLTRKNLSPEEMKSLTAQIPAGRMAEPRDISSVVAFLLSDLNTYLTGQNIPVDGGFTNV